MRNRFEHKPFTVLQMLRRLLPVLLICVIFLLFIGSVSSVDASTTAKQEESLQSAIHRDMLQCYAIEGTYPPNLDYLKEHYGLTYDENTFFVDYQTLGSNILPDVTVLRKGD